jgi:MoaA/NifB/PqqE/SkfB family radical SAM enzyme/SAM-dependent methyltransferase
MNNLTCWQRLEYDGRAVYINPEKPDWFVPNSQADILIQNLLKEGQSGGKNLDQILLGSQISTEPAQPYHGRANLLSLTTLKECWFHLTNHCNLACKHCLFSSSPSRREELSRKQLDQALSEAKSLGCTLFYFTGGEPFTYPDFPEIIQDLLKDPQNHVVVLTNGLLLEKHLDILGRLPRERLHLQLSMDGLENQHEEIRGKGTFSRLIRNINVIREAHIGVTLSMAVHRANVNDLPAMMDLAIEHGIKNIHLLYHFIRGKGSREQFIRPVEILSHLITAQKIGEKKGILIDNVELIRSQVFTSPGTRHDLSNTGWESVAVGPDGNIYPSPALVGMDKLNCGALTQGLEQVWRHSPVLERIRAATLRNTSYDENPLKFLVGGGDLDHSYMTGGDFAGHDPYVELYNEMALWLITRQAAQYPESNRPTILLRMGDVRYDCPDSSQEVSLTHCNCVISLSDDLGHSSVREFYRTAAIRANEDIVNPLAPDQGKADFIPMVSRQRSYGCGSPVSDAGVKQGETLVDLGSGSGVECFMAADMVGPEGRVYGIDMTDEMLELARTSKKEVVARLGYDNVEFKKGFLEELPLDDQSVDVIISNCVINLSPDKRRTFHEIFRVLKPGGRLVISDIVTDEEIPVAIKNDEKYRGECLGGAMRQEDLGAMLRATGFAGFFMIKRFPYRQEGETRFYSLTFRTHKPEPEKKIDLVYRGPFAAVYTESGQLLIKGRRARMVLNDRQSLDDSVFLFDTDGAVVNVEQEASCCGVAPEAVTENKSLDKENKKDRQEVNCMVCGSELRYLTRDQETACYYCGTVKPANALCENGHFVCDACHQQKGIAAIRKICTETREQDMITLLKKIRAHPDIPVHGPEHHAIMPGIILATYKNRGGEITNKDILTGIERGSKVPGGACGFWGSCGAAIGAGIAMAVLHKATPLTPRPRQTAMEVTAAILTEIAKVRAGRCCQRETVTGLKVLAQLSGKWPISLLADDTVACDQYLTNRECVRKQCPLWEGRNRNLIAPVIFPTI